MIHRNPLAVGVIARQVPTRSAPRAGEKDEIGDCGDSTAAETIRVAIDAMKRVGRRSAFRYGL
jgi:hypothetical protein